jgi:hypothetical protein
MAVLSKPISALQVVFDPERKAVLQLLKIGQKSGQRPQLQPLSGQPEQLSDKPDLTPNVLARDPPNLALPYHVHRLVALNRSPGRVEFSEALLGVNPAFDRAMVLLDDVVQVLNGSMATLAAQHPSLLNR